LSRPDFFKGLAHVTPFYGFSKDIEAMIKKGLIFLKFVNKMFPGLKISTPKKQFPPYIIKTIESDPLIAVMKVPIANSLRFCEYLDKF
jgi:hypothetical protein